MGNPLAPSLANFFLGHIEKKLFEENQDDKNDPAFYIRYVDDVFCVFRKSADYKVFFDKLNSLHTNLKFTCEFGGNSMPFLDTRVKLGPAEVDSTVFRKATNTNVVLHYDAVAPNTWKRGLVKCLLHRAKVVCSNEHNLNEEVAKLREIFSTNGYPTKFFDRIKQQVIGEKTNKAPTSKDEGAKEKELKDKQNLLFLKIPYVGKISTVFGRKIKSLLQPKDTTIKIVYETTKVQNSFQLKDPISKPLLARVVYQFTCRGDPGIKYIGQTIRTLKERVSEHLRGGTAVSDHIGQCQACQHQGVTINDFRVLKKCRKKNDPPIYEALIIRDVDPSLNRQLVKQWSKQITLKVF